MTNPIDDAAAEPGLGSADVTTIHHEEGGKGWFGHPNQLAWLFGTEMWERFGYYGMRVLLTLYLTKHFVLGDRAATGLYGGYTALVYLTPLVGGFIADQYLGSKKCIRFGAILMAIGYLTLAFGGAPSKPFAMIDGQRYEVQVDHFIDRPSSDPNESRALIVDGQKLKIQGNDDGSVSLLGSDGHVVRQIPKGGLVDGSDKDPLMVTIMLVALSLISVGNGFFKPNISTVVGSLYKTGDTRRDAGFTIFYMGINLGSFFGQIICAFLADYLGWWAGFGIAGIGMLVSAAMITFDGGRLTGYGDPPDEAAARKAPLIYGAALLAVALFYFLFSNLMSANVATANATGLVGTFMALPLLSKFLYLTFIVAVPGILAWSYAKGTREEFQMMVAAMVLITFNVVFWTLFEQAGSSLTLFADRNTDRHVIGAWTMSAPQTQNFNPFAIFLFAPLMSMLWGWLAKRNLEPSIPVKFALALIGVGGGFLFLVLGSHFAGPDYKVALWWLAGLYLLHSIAELAISPVGLSMITKLSIARVVGLMMGVWFLSISLAQSLAGLLAQSASVETVGGQVTNLRVSLETYVATYQKFGLITVGVGLFLLLLSWPLKKLMHGVK